MALPRPSSLLDQGMDTSRHYYWRQLCDMKDSAEVESMAPVALNSYAGICGRTRGSGAPAAR